MWAPHEPVPQQYLKLWDFLNRAYAAYPLAGHVREMQELAYIGNQHHRWCRLMSINPSRTSPDLETLMHCTGSGGLEQRGHAWRPPHPLAQPSGESLTCYRRPSFPLLLQPFVPSNLAAGLYLSVSPFFPISSDGRRICPPPSPKPVVSGATPSFTSVPPPPFPPSNPL